MVKEKEGFWIMAFNYYGKEMNGGLEGEMYNKAGKRREVGLLNKRGHIGRIIMSVPLLILLFFLMAGYVGAAAVLSKMKDIDRSGVVPQSVLSGEFLVKDVVALGGGEMKFISLFEGVINAKDVNKHAGGPAGAEGFYREKRKNEGVSDEIIEKEIEYWKNFRNGVKQFLKDDNRFLNEEEICLYFRLGRDAPYYFTKTPKDGQVRYMSLEIPESKLKKNGGEIKIKINSKEEWFVYYYGGCLK